MRRLLQVRHGRWRFEQGANGDPDAMRVVTPRSTTSCGLSRTAAGSAAGRAAGIDWELQPREARVVDRVRAAERSLRCQAADGLDSCKHGRRHGAAVKENRHLKLRPRRGCVVRTASPRRRSAGRGRSCCLQPDNGPEASLRRPEDAQDCKRGASG